MHTLDTLDRAWEITDEDIARALGVSLEAPSVQQCHVFFSINPSHRHRVRKAALYGNDIDEQSKYADEEIREILNEHGYC